MALEVEAVIDGGVQGDEALGGTANWSSPMLGGCVGCGRISGGVEVGDVVDDCIQGDVELPRLGGRVGAYFTP